MKCCQTNCDETGTERRNRSWYCPMHMRLRQMPIACRHDRKAVPPIDLLTQMATETIARNMACPLCGRTMNWLSRDGRTTCATLQHNRDGSFAIICLRCNVQHGQLPGDIYYAIPAGHKWCAGCEKTLPLDAFYPSRTIRQGVMSQCKKCAMKISNAWKKAKPRKARS